MSTIKWNNSGTTERLKPRRTFPPDLTPQWLTYIMLYMVKQAFEKEYLTIQQAARYLDVSAQTLRRWDSEGKLKSVRHPGNDYRYYKRSDLEPLNLKYKRAEQTTPGEFFQTSVANIENNQKLREPQR